MKPSHRSARSEPVALDPHAAAVRLERQSQHRHRQRRQLQLGIASVVGIVLMLGVGLWIYERNAAAEAAAHEHHQAEVRALHDELAKLQANDPAQARAALARLEATRSHWQAWPEREQFRELESTVRGTIAADERDRGIAAVLSRAQAALAKDPVDVAALRASRGEVHELSGKKLAAPLHAQVVAVHSQLSRGLCSALQRSGTAATDARAGLAALTEAADLAEEALAACRGDAAATAEWQRTAGELRAAVSQTEAKVLQPDVIAACPWQDLVPGTSSKDWQHSRAPGLSSQVAGDALVVDGPAADQKVRGSVALEQQSWRACELQCDVELQGAAAWLLLRTGKATDPKHGAAVHLATHAGKDTIAVAAGKPVHLDALLVGDHLVVKSDGEPREFDATVATETCTGGLAIVTDPGTHLVIKNLRVRKLL